MTRSRASGGEGGVPAALGVDDGDGAALADAQAADLRAVDGGGALARVQFADGALEPVPGGRALLGRAAVGAGANEDVAGVAAPRRDAPASARAPSSPACCCCSFGPRSTRAEDRGIRRDGPATAGARARGSPLPAVWTMPGAGMGNPRGGAGASGPEGAGGAAATSAACRADGWRRRWRCGRAASSAARSMGGRVSTSCT